MTDEPTGPTDAPDPEGTLPPPAAETPTEPTPPTTPRTPPITAPLESVPVDEPTAAAPVTATAEPRRRGVFVPVWALVTVAGLLLLAAGGLVGYAIGANDDGGDGRAVRAGGFQLPERLVPPGFGQFGNGNGNGNGGNGGNGHGNSGGNGNGGPTTDNGAFLGVGVQDSTNPRGAELVRVVANSPAADAGLKTGDVITAVDGKDVTGAASLTTQIRAHSSGDDVQITYTRNGTSSTVKVTLGDRTPTSSQ